jgi:hypothetical protein
MNRNFGFLAKKAGGQGTRTNPIVNISRSAAGNVITFNIDSNLPSGQELYYSIDGTVSTNDFIAETLTGNVTLDINGNASVDFTANLEPTGNVSEFFFNLRKTSISGISIGTSGNVVLESNNAVNATGGTIQDVGTLRYHTFNTSNSLFNISNTSSNAVIQFLLVARGGDAGTDPSGLEGGGGGGGGAGGVVIGRMWALKDNEYQIIPATTVTAQGPSTFNGNIIIAEPVAGNTFVSLRAPRGGNGGNTGLWPTSANDGGSGGGAGCIRNIPGGDYRINGQGFASGNYSPLPNGSLDAFGNNGNVSQYWRNYPTTNSHGRNGGAGGGGAGSQGLTAGAISPSGPGGFGFLDDGGNGGNGYVWIDGNNYSAGGPGQGRLGAPNGTTQASIAGAGLGPGVPAANVFGLIKFAYEMLPRNIEIL